MISIRIFGTPVKIKATVLPLLFALWAALTWANISWYPQRSFWQNVLIGFAAMLVLLPADFGHALAHIFSAHYAGAPMDEVLIAADMPRTIYRDNDVAPEVHRMRALGGPIYNAVGFLVSMALFAIVPGYPMIRELLAWSALGHALIFVMSLAPLPIVDGGTILKWTLVIHGKTAAQADQIVKRIDWGLGAILVLAGIGFLLAQIWIVGLILLVAGLAVFGVTAGLIR